MTSRREKNVPSIAGMQLTRSNLTNNMYFELFTSVATGYNNAKKLLDREYLLHDI